MKDGEVIVGEEELEEESVHLKALGEGKGLAHEPAKLLAGGKKEALDVVGFTLAELLGPVLAGQKRRSTGGQLVGVDGLAGILGRDAFHEKTAALF